LGVSESPVDNTSTIDWVRTNLFHGHMTEINFWSKALTLSEMINVTQNCLNSSQLSPDLFDWFQVSFVNKAYAYMTVENFTKSSSFCQISHDTVPVLFHRPETFETAKKICQSFSGSMFEPKDSDHLNEVKEYIDMGNTLVAKCKKSFWIGVTKIGFDNVQNQNGQLVDYKPWGAGEPNGREFQKCIRTIQVGKSKYFWLFPELFLKYFLGNKWVYWDYNCDMGSCFVCQVPSRFHFTLRGPLSGSEVNLDSEYTIMTTGWSYQGFNQTQIIWIENEHRWYLYNIFSGAKGYRFGFIDSSHPLGLRQWNISQRIIFLKLTQVRGITTLINVSNFFVSAQLQLGSISQCKKVHNSNQV
jgi:hypothetical protein